MNNSRIETAKNRLTFLAIGLVLAATYWKNLEIPLMLLAILAGAGIVILTFRQIEARSKSKRGSVCCGEPEEKTA